jgi:hypothetical protein
MNDEVYEEQIDGNTVIGYTVEDVSPEREAELTELAQRAVDALITASPFSTEADSDNNCRPREY